MTLLTTPETDQDHEDRLVQARLNWTHMQQSIERALGGDEEFAKIMCDPSKNPSPTIADLSPHRTLN